MNQVLFQSMKKKIFKISLLLIILLVVLYFISTIYRIVQINLWQNKIGETLPDTFRIELPVVKNHDGYFCVRSTINGEYEADL